MTALGVGGWPNHCQSLFEVIVYTAVPHPRLASPWVDIRADLARPHVPNSRLVPEVAHFRVVALLRSVRIVALEGREVSEPGEWSWVPHPLDGLPVGDDPYFGHFIYRVEKSDEAFFMMGLCEPSCMVEQPEWCPVGSEVPFEVLDKHLVDPVGCWRVGAGITH